VKGTGICLSFDTYCMFNGHIFIHEFFDRCLRTLVVVSIMVSCSGNFAILTMFFKILFILCLATSAR